MPSDVAFVGVADHAGWAVLVTAAADGTLLDRRRVELVDAGVPAMPYHHDAQGLPLDEAEALVERVRLSAERNARLVLETLASAVPRIAGVALRECPPLPPTIEERLRNYRAQNVADWVTYRQAIAGAAEARGWAVHWYAPKTVVDAARDAVVDLESRIAEVRRTLGPPWTQDHRVAMAAAVVASSVRSTTRPSAPSSGGPSR